MKKMTTHSNESLFIAIHEAGHALIWWYFGLTLIEISAVPGHDSGIHFNGICKVYFDDSSKVESITHNMFSAQYVFGKIAGRVATEVLCPEMMPGSGHHNDFQTIKNLRAIDADVLKMHAWRTKNPDADVEMFYQEFKTPVMNIIKSKRGKRSILALAKALVKYGKLSGRESARTLSEAWGNPLPAFAIPFEQHSAIIENNPKSFNDLMSHIQIFMRLLKKDILPLRDSNLNSEYQNKIIDRISGLIAHIQVMASDG